MDRVSATRVIAILLGVYAVYTALFLPGMFVAPVLAILLIGTIAKVAASGAAAVGVWRMRGWAAAAIIVTGVVVAAMWLLEAFVLGLVAALTAMAFAAIAVLLCLAAAGYIQRRRPPRFA